MKVILQQDVPNLGSIGEVVRVRDGFGRNYLVPRGLAVVADERNSNRLAHQTRQAANRAERIRRESQEMADVLSKTAVSIKHKAGEEGKLFGSVTNREIAEALAAEGHHIDRRNIVLDEPIKTLGVFNVPVRLHAEVQAVVKVFVVQE